MNNACSFPVHNRHSIYSQIDLRQFDPMEVTVRCFNLDNFGPFVSDDKNTLSVGYSKDLKRKDNKNLSLRKWMAKRLSC